MKGQHRRVKIVQPFHTLQWATFTLEPYIWPSRPADYSFETDLPIVGNRETSLQLRRAEIVLIRLHSVNYQL